MPNRISPEFPTGNPSDVASAAHVRISVINGGVNNLEGLRPIDPGAALAPALGAAVTAPKETGASVRATPKAPQSLAQRAYTLAVPADVTLSRLHQ